MTMSVRHAEWEDKEAFTKHIKSDYVKEFAKYIEEVPVLLRSRLELPAPVLPLCPLVALLPQARVSGI